MNPTLRHVRARRRLRRGLVVVCTVAAVMLPVLGATAAEKARSTPTTQPDTSNAEAAIPSFDLVDLRSGRSVDLATLRTPGRAMLVWLWAPG